MPRPLWLSGMAMGLIVLIGTELHVLAERDRPLEPVPPTPVEPAEPLPLPDLALGPLSRLVQTTARPLFRQDRRPPPMEAPVEEPPEEAAQEEEQAEEEAVEAAELPEPPAARMPQPRPKLRYSLSAVVISRDDAIAYLSGPDDPGLTGLRQGESIDGWRLTAVRPDAVVLDQGEHRVELKLRSFEQAAPVSVPGDPIRSFESADEYEDSTGRILTTEHALDQDTEFHRPQRPQRGPREGALERALRRTIPDPAN